MTSTEIKQLNDLQKDIEQIEQDIRGTTSGIKIYHNISELKKSKYDGLYDKVRELMLDYLNEELHDQTERRDMLTICIGKKTYSPIDITNL